MFTSCEPSVCNRLERERSDSRPFSGHNCVLYGLSSVNQNITADSEEMAVPKYSATHTHSPTSTDIDNHRKRSQHTNKSQELTFLAAKGDLATCLLTFVNSSFSLWYASVFPPLLKPCLLPLPHSPLFPPTSSLPLLLFP